MDQFIVRTRASGGVRTSLRVDLTDLQDRICAQSQFDFKRRMTSQRNGTHPAIDLLRNECTEWNALTGKSAYH